MSFVCVITTITTTTTTTTTAILRTPPHHYHQDYHGLIQKIRFYSSPTLEFVSPKDATHCVWMGDLGYRLNFNMNQRARDMQRVGDRR